VERRRSTLSCTVTYARVNNKRYTLVVRRLTDSDTTSAVLAQFLDLLNTFEFDVKWSTPTTASTTASVSHSYTRTTSRTSFRSSGGDAIKAELNQGWSREIEHDPTTEFDGDGWTVEFPVRIGCMYKRGKFDEHGVALHSYTADAPFINTPQQARYLYAKRFCIGAYRLSESTLISTTTGPTRRMLFVVISLFYRTWGGSSTESTWRRPAGASVVSGGGRSKSSSTLKCGCGDAPTHSKGRPREPTTPQPVLPVVTDRVRLFGSGNFPWPDESSDGFLERATIARERRDKRSAYEQPDFGPFVFHTHDFHERGERLHFAHSPRSVFLPGVRNSRL